MSENWEELEDGLFATKTVLYDGYKLDVPDTDDSNSVHLAVADYGGPVAVVPAVLNDDDVDGVFFTMEKASEWIPKVLRILVVKNYGTSQK